MFRFLFSTLLISASLVLSGQIPEFDHFCPPSGSSGITKASSIAIDNDGVLYVADAGERRVLAFGLDGEFMTDHTYADASKFQNVLGCGYTGELLGYDEASGKITVHRKGMIPFRFGEKGNKPGQLGQVSGLAMDAEGYTYALNSSKKQIDVYDPQGRYLTWISGGSEEIHSPVSLCISGLNEICLLDDKGPSVIMYNPDGVQVNMHRNFAGWNTVNASDPVSMACLPDGTCLIADEKNQSITLIGRHGHVKGSFGSQGSMAPGAFAEIQFIAASPNGKYIAIWDRKSQSAQVFISQTEQEIKPATGRLLMVEHASSSRPALITLAALPDGNQAAVKASNSGMVVIFKDTSSVEVSSLLSDFKGISSIAADKEGRVYALDENRDEIYVFDTNGRQLRKIGQEIKDKLKNPVSIAIQSNNQLLVCDAGNGRILAWDDTGIFLRVLNSASSSILEDPRKICTDSKDRIYILDAKTNSIYRTPANGWPMDIVFLRARSERPGGEAGKILDFFIDEQDQLFLLNGTTRQVELYQWDTDPVFKCSVGHGGQGDYSLADVEWMVFDPASYRIDMTAKSGIKNSIQVGLKPPPPTGTPVFSASEGKLILSFERVASPLVDGYALLRSNAPPDEHTLATRSSGGLLELDESVIPGTELYSYKFVSMGKAGMSDASLEFPNYIGHAERLLTQDRFEEALGSFEKSLKAFGYADGIKRYVAKRYHEIALTLSANYEGEKAVRCLKASFDLYPENPELKNSAVQVFKAHFIELAGRGDVAGLVAVADRYRVVSGLRSSVFTAMDSTIVHLNSSTNPQLTETAVSVGKKLCEWAPSDASYALHLTEAYLHAYDLEKQLPGTFNNAANLLVEAEFYAKKASEIRIANATAPFEEELALMATWEEIGKYQEIVQLASRSLEQYRSKLNPGFEAAYRIFLGDASMETAQFAMAAEQYRKLNSLLPARDVFREELIDALIADGDLEAARKLCPEGLLKGTGDAHAHASLGRIALAENNYEEAIFQLDKAVHGMKVDPRFAGDLATAYRLAGNSAKAVESYEIALSYYRQQLSRTKGSGQDGRRMLKERLDLLHELAKLAVQIKDHERAVASYEELLTLKAEDASLWLEAGLASIETGEVYRGVGQLEQARKLNGKNAEIISAYDKAIEQRKKYAQNKAPLEIHELDLQEIRPSLYLNYANSGVLPAGYAYVANNTSNAISLTSVKLEVGKFGMGSGVSNSGSIPPFSVMPVPLALVCSEDILENTKTRLAEANVTIEYSNGKQAKRSGQIVLQARNAIRWADKRCLAAFVSPSDQHFIEFTKSIDKELRSALSLEMPDAILKAVQAYTVLQSMQFTYSPDPVQSYALSSTSGDLLDYMQYPSETLQRRAGDCDDLVALFAEMTERSGVPSAYIDVPGHVLFAFNSGIRINELNSAGIDPEEVVNINGQAWIPLETTLIERHEFLTAWKKGAERYYQELARGNYPTTVPLADARKSYTPSEYWPDNMEREITVSPNVLPAYEDEVTDLFAKLNQRKILHMETRYRSEPNNLYVKNRYALLLAKAGEIEMAEQILNKATEDSPGNPILLNNLGNVMLLAHRDDDAIKYYLEASDADPADVEILINLCKVYLRKGDKTSAKEAYQQALALNADIAFRYDYLQSELK